MSSVYSISEAKTHLSKLVRQAEQGEEAIPRRGSRPVVRIVAFQGDKRDTIRRRPGSMRGRVTVPDGFDEWPEDVAHELGHPA